jgi:hypothetical protein
MADQLEINMIVEAIAKGFDQLIANVTKTNKVVTDSERQAEAMTKRMGFASEMAAQKQSELTRQQKALADANLKLGASFTAVAAAGGALLGSSIQLAARVQTLGIVTVQLGKNIGYSEEKIRSLEKSVQAQGITIQAARQSIARMIQANIDLSKATDLARVAQDAAVIAGINSSEAFDNLVTSLATGQVRMLHTMGIQVLYEDGYKKLAATIGKTTDELTEEERAQARLNIVLEGGKNILGTYEAAMTTAGKKVTSLARYIEDSRVALGEMWLPVYADAIDALTSSLKWWQGLSDETKTATSTVLGLTTVVAGVEGAVFLLIGTLQKAKLAMAAFNVAMAGMGFAATALSIAIPIAILTTLASVIYIGTKRVEDQNQTFIAAEKAAREAAKGYQEYIDKVKEAAALRGIELNRQGQPVRVTEYQNYYQQGAQPVRRESPVPGATVMTEAEWIERRTRATRAQYGLTAQLPKPSEFTGAIERTTGAVKFLNDSLKSDAIDDYWRGITMGADALDNYGSKANRAAQETKKLEEEQAKAKQAISDFLSIMDKDVGSPIASFVEEMKWVLAGGGRINDAFKALQEGVQAGVIPPDLAQTLGGELLAGAQDLAVTLDPSKLNEAATLLSETLDIPIEEAKRRILGTDGIMGALQAIQSTEWQINFKFNYLGQLPPGFGGPEMPLYRTTPGGGGGGRPGGNVPENIQIPTPEPLDPGLIPGEGQHGLSMTVPSRYSESQGRPFLFAASGGEHVSIQTPSQSQASMPGASSGIVIQMGGITIQGDVTARKAYQVGVAVGEGVRATLRSRGKN